MLERLSGGTLDRTDFQPEQEEAEKSGPARLRVRCFGRFRVLLPDGRELHWRTRKAQELFAYLFHMNGARVDREKLLDLLWPKAAPGSATSLLHTSLYSIRKALHPFELEHIILWEKTGYRMDMDLLTSDRSELDRVCREQKLGETPLSQLYEGPYLEDIESDWAEGERAVYAGAFLRASRAIGEEQMEAGDFRAAADCLRSALAQEPYDEELAGLLLQCYGAMGQIKNAMTCYNRLRDTLAEDLGTEPGQELTRIYRECLLRRLGNGRAV